MRDFLSRIKEVLNLFIYDYQERFLKAFRFLTFISSIGSIGIQVYYFGFDQDPERSGFLIRLIKILLGVYILNYLIRLFFSLKVFEFLRQNALEGVLILLLMVDMLEPYLFGFELFRQLSALLGIANFESFYIVFIQFFMLLLEGIKMINITPAILNLKIRPALIPFAAFGLLILGGAGLLMLPESTVTPGSMKLIDALFTSASAACVTGFSSVDTASFFTFKGQLVILVLIQLGGIGIITFASFFVFFIKRGMGLKSQTVLRNYLDEGSWSDSGRLIRNIIGYTLLIELLGCLLVYNLWPPEVEFSSRSEKLYYSIFHTVSSFCNAGFALFKNNFAESSLQGASLLHLAFAFLIIFGGLGFPTLRDLFGIKNIRNRLKLPWLEWKTSTNIAVFSTIFLLFGGMGMFYLLEHNAVLASMSVTDGLVASFFQSAAARTAGLNTVDIGALQTPTIILCIFLMFIGACSGSMGGGIKTSTFVVILTSCLATIRMQKHLVIGRRTISHELLHRAFSIFIFYSLYLLLSIFLLSLAEPGVDILKLVFEATSALGTVGWTMGITSTLTPLGKSILIASMYIGRLGPLTLAFALSAQVQSTDYKYPNTQIMVG